MSILTTIFTAGVTAMGFGITLYQIKLSELHRQEDVVKQDRKDRAQDSLIKKDRLSEEEWHKAQATFTEKQISAMQSQATSMADQLSNQKSYNKQQFHLNRNLIAAAKSQAITLKEQYKQQKEQLAQQRYEQRPIFTIDSISVTNSKNYKTQLKLSYSNIGIRSAHIDSTIIAFWTPDARCRSITRTKSDLELLPTKNSQVTPEINIYNDCLNDKSTIYYFILFYKDSHTEESKIEPIFFNYTFLPGRRFAWSKVSDSRLIEFKKFLKKKNVFYLE